MPEAIYGKILSFINAIANIGITPQLDHQEKSRTRILNIVVTLGFPLSLFFTFLNFSQHRYLLSGINFLTFISGVAVLISNFRQHFQASRIILNCFCSFIFCTGAILYRNGIEYGILANMLVSIIFFRDKRILFILTFINVLMFIGVKIFLLSSYTFYTVPEGRIIFNTCWSIFITLLSLLYLKKEQDDYLTIIEEKNKELQKLNSNKEKLFSIIAHDLRSPLGQLKSLLEMVNHHDISIEQFQHMSVTLASEVDRLHNTMDNLLKWSISQSQGIRANPEKLLLAPLLDEAQLLFKQKIEKKNLTIQIEHAQEVAVWADRNHLLLILRNLLSNAIKFSNPGSTIQIISSVEKSDMIIQFIDTGKGLSPEAIKQIFTTEQIISTPGTANEKGTGLGLKLCKEFIEENHGRIWVTSEEQKGSTFSFSLPLAS
jgi:signal transduction histidine kinase